MSASLTITPVNNKDKPIFELENVDVFLGNNHVLDKINLKIFQGEKVVILGPSGVGKTTLLKLLNCSLAPTNGVIKIMGKDINKNSKSINSIQKLISTIYQDLCLIENLQVIHNINVGKLSSWSSMKSLLSLIWPLNVSNVRKILVDLKIEDKLFEQTYNLSGGQKQLVAIARTICQDPEIILADEPISNLDPDCSTRVMDLLTTLSNKNQKTLIVSLHQVDVAEIYFERVILLQNGKIFKDCMQSELNPLELRRFFDSGINNE